MKKIKDIDKKLLIIIGVLAVVIAGGIMGYISYKNNKIESMVVESVKYLDDKQYDKAINECNLILGEKPNELKAQQIKDKINTYLDAESLYKSNNFELADGKINQLKDYDQYKGFTTDVNNLKEQISTAIKQIKDGDNTISKTRELLDKDKISEAKDTLSKLSIDKLSDSQKQQVKDLKARIKSEEDKQKAEEQAKKEKEEKEAKEKQQSSNKSSSSYSVPMSIEQSTRYINEKLGKSHNATYYYMCSDERCEGTCYKFKERQNAGVNGPNYVVDPNTGDIWVDDLNEEFVVTGNLG